MKFKKFKFFKKSRAGGQGSGRGAAPAVLVPDLKANARLRAGDRKKTFFPGVSGFGCFSGELSGQSSYESP